MNIIDFISMYFFNAHTVGGKSFGFVHIDIECKNISISGDIGGLYCLPYSPNLGKQKRFILAYPELLTGSEIYQNNTLQFSSKTH